MTRTRRGRASFGDLRIGEVSLIVGMSWPSLLLGVALLGIGLIHLFWTNRTMRMYGRLNRNRSPGNQFWVGSSRYTVQGGGLLMSGFGVLLILSSLR